MAAGIINTNAIQLQFLLNHASFTARFNANINTIESNPHGNKRKVEGLEDGIVGIINWFEYTKVRETIVKEKS